MQPNTEPVWWANITAAIMALLGMLVALNVISLLPDQMQSIEAALGAVLAVVAPLFAAAWTRTQVTPVAEPRDSDGTPLVRQGGAQPLAVQRRMGG